MDRMRSMHDAILVGVNTLIMDDPRLQSMWTVRKVYVWEELN